MRIAHTLTASTRIEWWLRRHCVNSLSVKYVDEPLPSDLSEVKVLAKREPKAKETSSLLEQLLSGKKD